MKNGIKNIRLFIVIIVLVLIGSSYALSRVNTYASLETGHPEFRSIKFVNDRSKKLLVEYSEDDLKTAMKKINRRFIGWSTYYFCNNEKVNYDGQILFSRSNKTGNSINFEYTLKETEVVKTAVTVGGSVSAKISGTVQKINLGLGAEAKASISSETSDTYTSDAKTTINVNIPPRTKITLIETGEGYLTSGVSKYYLLGIVVRKGNWERIDVDTLYFELREELY